MPKKTLLITLVIFLLLGLLTIPAEAAFTVEPRTLTVLVNVAIIFNGFSGDWLKTSAWLWGLTEKISFYIEPILLDSTEDRSGFVKHIIKTGQVIYQAE